ncbi:hypothetical protein B586_18030 [Mycobacterium haemophilum DSM 44634]|nr:hypothetical protein B586_18030 [Mycobacterium haemophilum DSM 44634]MCV7342414.1 sensor histidine kinase [Mycobacterium haemophilum DSM 44634]
MSPSFLRVPAVPAATVVVPAGAARPAKRPSAWALGNWPVRWKIVVIVLVPLLLATAFGGLRLQSATASSSGLQLAAARADLIPTITKYMSALDVALLASSIGHDVEGAKKNYEARKYELQTRLANTDVIPDVRSGTSTLLNGGQALVDKVLADSISLRDRVTTYAPILLTAEDVINASVRIDSEQIRAQAQGLSRAVGARGQMTAQKILITRGAEIPEPELRTSMITLAGTEPSTLFGMSEVLGVGSPKAQTLQQQLVTRMAVLSDPASMLVDNPELLRSIEITSGIVEQIIKDATTSVTKSMEGEAAARRGAAIRDTVIVPAAVVIALGIVLLVARSLIRPLRVLRDGALKVTHTDLENEIAQVRSGTEPIPELLAVPTTEEIGQLAHAVDALHTQALLLAGNEARLATRLRRSNANLLVLAGARLARDPRKPVPLSTVINAAVSEVEDYRRVETAGVPDCTVIGAAAGSVIHLLAELIDNALRYSPPTTLVWVSAARGGDGAVLVRVADSGLGMNDTDRRIANMRLQAGGAVTPDLTPENARHMGLFVVGRLAARHGIRVGLRGPIDDAQSPGTTAEVYLPLAVLVARATPAAAAGPRAPGWAPQQPKPAPRHAAAVRDPEAVRGSISSHVGGVRSGRSHALENRLETREGPDQQ